MQVDGVKDDVAWWKHECEKSTAEADRLHKELTEVRHQLLMVEAQRDQLIKNADRSSDHINRQFGIIERLSISLVGQ